ncbi:peptide MFS transporter [Campylobacter jejuni]|nr:peptide MFS transporter [Campylobacter jejuni]
MDIFREKNIYFSSIGKFTLGILFAGIGFMMMTFASQNLIDNNGLPISMAWIIISIFFLTLGELCVSPIGLSIMAKVAPDLIKNQIMGLWFVASALGNFVAGLIGGNVNIKNIDQLPNIFRQCMWMLFVVALLLFIAKKPS